MRIYQPEKILVPVDFSDISLGILQAGVDIAKRWNAEVLALHVARESEHIPRIAYNPPMPSIANAYGSIPLGKLREDARFKIERRLQDMVRQVEGGQKVASLVLWGDAVEDIVHVAEEGNFDLIVMATHGRRGAARMFLGSVTEQVMRRAPCPVFAIRIKPGKQLLAHKEAEGVTTGST